MIKLPFEYPWLAWLLLLLPALFILFIYAKRKKKQTFRKLGDPELVKELIADYIPGSFARKFYLTLVAILLLLLAILNLRTPSGTKQISRNGIDVMIALDVSKSMLAQDIKPDRLDRAKQLLSKLIDRLGNDRVGLIVFAGKSYLQMPLTADHAAAKMYLDAASTETVPTQGTVIGDALRMSYASFNQKEKKYKAVVLVSDGEDHDDNAIKTAEQMAEEGVVICTVGIGSPEGAPIMDEATNNLKKDNEGNIVISKLNEAELQEIAAKGNGNYQLFTNSDAVVGGLYSQLSGLDTRNVTDDSLINWKSWFQYLLGAALILLLIEMFLPEIRRARRPAIAKAALALLLPFLCLTAGAQKTASDKEKIKAGNVAYSKADFDAAAANYLTAAKENGDDAVAQYNLGNALFKSGKKPDAAAAYDKAFSSAEKPESKSAALYNKGVILQADKKTDECIAAYENALKLDPANADARHNLEIALRQKKQQNKGGGGQNKNKNNKDNKPDKSNNKNQPNPSGMSQKDAAQKLQALADKEGQLQDKLHKVSAAAPDKPEKDW